MKYFRFTRSTYGKDFVLEHLATCNFHGMNLTQFGIPLYLRVSEVNWTTSGSSHITIHIPVKWISVMQRNLFNP